MVLSLVELSLRSITKGMKNGTIRHPHLLPPKLRERIWETAFKQDVANHPNVLEILTSVEFLTGMTSISADSIRRDDLDFMELLADSLDSKLPNGETVGAAITKLTLDVHEYVPGPIEFFSTVYDLVAQCPNTKSLELRVAGQPNKRGYWPLNENGTWIRVMENLVELSLVNWTQIGNMRPLITFDRLTTLLLDRCILMDNQWFELLENMPFLENLHFINVRNSGNWQQKKLDWILPFPLPHLKSLKFEIIGDGQIFECNKTFVDNLIGCPKLRQVHLILDKESTDEECLVQLANMNIDLKMQISLSIDGHNTAENAAILDSSSRFKVVRIFNERIDYFELLVSNWDSRFSRALEDVVGTCSNLTMIGITLPKIESEEDMKRVNAAMVQFFGNWEHAMKLTSLTLSGNFDDAVFSTVFETCLNLIGLYIYWCPALRDQHLIDWVARGGGGNLITLVLFGCHNVTSEGVIPILAMSADGLLRYCIRVDEDNGGRNWETELRILCPNVRLEMSWNSVSSIDHSPF